MKRKKTSAKNSNSKIYNFLVSINDNKSTLFKLDLIIMGILMVIYSCFAFTNLGSNTNPQTFYEFTVAGEEAGIEIVDEAKTISKIRVYSGVEVGDYEIFVSIDGSRYDYLNTLSQDTVFAWTDHTIDSTFKYIKFVAKGTGTYIGEIALYDNYGNRVDIKAADDQSEGIVDEKEAVPATISYKNSAYFDEIYFARSAYEYIHGIPTNEWVHPPLGKLIMTLPILIMGMTPFAYRLMGTIAGLLMIPVLYILAKRLFKSRKWATLAGILMTFDCFHFAQTRMGTVDSFLVLFIMLAALFMYQFIMLDKKDKRWKKLTNLFFSGLFIGCAIATKWTGLYAGLALAIAFFVEVIYTHTSKKRVKDKDLKSIIVACVAFFMVIPFMIYVFSYLLFPEVYLGPITNLKELWWQTKDIFSYHSNLIAEHSFTSKWYTWPAMYKPVWYYVGYFGGNIKSTIVGIGNPAIWWVGIAGSIYLLIESLRKRNKENLFIVVFILCSWLPYVFIGRIMFMYHYFPTLPFVMLAVVALIRYLTIKLKTNLVYFLYVSLVVIMFLYFYPVISGLLTTTGFIDQLRWFSSWIF